ncbi:LacI family DNA-binding transcriptional regulator [Bacillus sp. FJAT-49731]|uniref:LacI family DNA-binding transcriptional regulator n=2 Tax=Lederbergia citrea TaxID=2833581 RepID=A0A942UNH3_9BACI|nr:LacI family DNA-binding transcriptional regulator [Lederbergia citrea]MBS4204266.1 LacI family DNA-binding transcriptional regulator [Lederbergia citrea]MBS4221149.1 LacI family DNA-binding transcriptional regulator [Lederbergia citrea]
MQDIADRLNISKNSVSIALTGKSGVGEDLRQKIIEVATEIGYPIQKLSDKNKSDNELMIGLIAREDIFSENTFFGIINLNIEKEVKARNGQLLIHSVDENNELNNEIPSFITEKKIDGLLVLSHLKKEYIQQLANTGIPLVLIDHHDYDLNVDSILTDNRKGAFVATRYLLSNGTNTIGFIGQVDKSPSYKERFEGFTYAVKEAGIKQEEKWLIHSIKEDEAAIENYIENLDSLPDAWLCANDEYGFLLTRILSSLGYKIAEDVSICGFDNSYFSTLSLPQLSTIDIDKEYFAKRAVVQLYNRIEDNNLPPEKILLGTQLLKRNSVKD